MQGFIGMNLFVFIACTFCIYRYIYFSLCQTTCYTI